MKIIIPTFEEVLDKFNLDTEGQKKLLELLILTGSILVALKLPESMIWIFMLFVFTAIFKFITIKEDSKFDWLLPLIVSCTFSGIVTGLLVMNMYISNFVLKAILFTIYYVSLTFIICVALIKRSQETNTPRQVEETEPIAVPTEHRLMPLRKTTNLIPGLYILLFALLIVALSIFVDFIVSLYTHRQPDYLIQTQMTSTILAFSTVVLVIITVGYAKSTKDLLDEQIKLRKIASFEKRLENIYSPINIAFNRFKLNCESLLDDRIPSVYNNEFKDLNDLIMNIARKYGHLFNQDTINYYDNEVWKAWLQYSSNSTIDNYKLLNSRIIEFNRQNTMNMNREMGLLVILQNS